MLFRAYLSTEILNNAITQNNDWLTSIFVLYLGRQVVFSTPSQVAYIPDRMLTMAHRYFTIRYPTMFFSLILSQSRLDYRARANGRRFQQLSPEPLSPQLQPLESHLRCCGNSSPSSRMGALCALRRASRR